eukprot:ANDGO_04558.mRNA.1 Adenylate cyclase
MSSSASGEESDGQDVTSTESTFALLSPFFSQCFIAGSRMKRRLCQPGPLHLLWIASFVLFAFSQLFVNDIRSSVRDSLAADVVVWAFFGISFLNFACFLKLLSRFHYGDPGQTSLSNTVRWTSWFIVATIPVQYMFLRAYALEEDSIRESRVDDAESVLLFIHFSWSMFILAPFLTFLCADTSPFDFSVQSVSVGFFLLVTYGFQIFIMFVDFISIAAGIRALYTVFSIALSLAILVGFLYVLPWKTPEGNALTLYPFLAVIFNAAFEASRTTSSSIILPVSIGSFLLLWASCILSFRRHVGKGLRIQEPNPEISASDVFDRDLYLLSQTANPFDCEIALRTMLRNRLGVSTLHSFPFCFGFRKVQVSVDDGQEILQLYSTALDVFPLSSFLAGQFCVLGCHLNLVAGRAYVWSQSATIIRLALMQKVRSLWSASTIFEFYHGLISLRSSTETIGLDGNLGLRQIRAEMGALDRIRKEIIVLTAIFWKEVLVVSSQSRGQQQQQQQHPGLLTKWRLFGRWKRKQRCSTLDLSHLWSILSYAEDREYRGSMIIRRMESMPMITPEMLRCRARWFSDVEHNSDLSSKLLAQADTLEDHMTRFTRSPHGPRKATGNCGTQRRTVGVSVDNLKAEPFSAESSLPPRPVPPRSSSAPEELATHGLFIPAAEESAGQLASSNPTMLQVESVPTVPSSANVPSEAADASSTISDNSTVIQSDASSRARRLKDLRVSVMQRKSSTIWRMQLALIGTLLVSAILIIALFVVSRTVIRSPVTKRFVEGESANSEERSAGTEAISLPLESIARMRRPIGSLALVYRTLTLPFFLSSSELDFYRIIFPSILASYRFNVKIVLVEEHLVSLDSYWTRQTSSFNVFSPIPVFQNSSTNRSISDNFIRSSSTVQQSNVIRNFDPILQGTTTCSQSLTAMNISYYVNTSFVFMNLQSRCVELTLEGWFNSLLSVWNVVDAAVPLYQQEILDYVDNLFLIVLICALSTFFVTLLFLVCVIVPSLIKTYDDQKRVMLLNLEFDKSSLKGEYLAMCEGIAKLDVMGSRRPSIPADRPPADVQHGGSNARNSHFREKRKHETLRATQSYLSSFSGTIVNQELSGRRYLFVSFLIVIAVIFIILYCQIFTILLSLFVRYLRSASFEVQYMSSVNGILSRATASAFETFPISYPSIGKLSNPSTNESALYPLYVRSSQNYASLALTEWTRFIDGDGSNTTGVKYYSENIKNALFSQRSATLYPSFFPDTTARSLAADISTAYDDIISLTAKGTDSTVLWTIYKARLQGLLFSVIPKKFDDVYTLIVEYYDDRTDTLLVVANICFGLSFIFLPLLYYFCFHKALNQLKQRERQMRKMLCTLSLETLLTNPQVVTFMATGSIRADLPRNRTKNLDNAQDSLSVVASDKSSVKGDFSATRGDLSSNQQFGFTGPQWCVRTMPVALFQVVGSSQLAKHVQDPRFVVREANGSCLRMFGHSEFEVLGSALESFFLVDDDFMDFQRYLSTAEIADMISGVREFRLRAVRRNASSRGNDGTHNLDSLSSPPVTARSGKEQSKRGTFHCVVVAIPDAIESESAGRRVFAVYVRDVTEEIRQRSLLELEKQKSTDLLLNMMPAPIVDRLKRNERPIAFSHKSVSCIFVDLVGFSTMCQDRIAEGPGAIVSVLDDLYTRFDLAADTYQVFKIKIIGDCWFGATGLHFDKMYGTEQQHDLDVQNEALCAVRFCLDVIKIANEFGMHVRCGVHTGPVVSGVISKNRYLYDIYGHSVNYAARLEQTCPKIDGVHMSRETYELLYPWFECAEVESVLKGLGRATTYLLVSIRRDPDNHSEQEDLERSFFLH